MILIFGGKYQGKLEYALENYGEKFSIKESDVFKCQGDEIDYSKKVICNLEEFVWQCTLKGAEARDLIDWEMLRDKIVICEDMSQGLVPMDKNERAFREMIGRTLLSAGKKADHVVRVFCGLGSILK